MTRTGGASYLTLAALVLSWSAPAHAVIQDLDKSVAGTLYLIELYQTAAGVVFNPPPTSVVATAISSNSQVVGFGTAGRDFGFNVSVAAPTGSEIRATAIKQPDSASYVQPRGVNAAGTVVGTKLPRENAPGEAFKTVGTGTTATVTSIETATSRALGINASGQIVGQNNEGKAFLYQGDGPDRSLTDVPSEARAINDGGTVVGWHEVGGHPQAFVYDGAGIRNLFAPVSDESEASAINNAGDVAGSITDYEGNRAGIGGAERTAFQLRAGSTTPELLTGPPGEPILAGYDDTFATGINASHWVVGGATGNGQDRATAWLWVDGQLFDLSKQLVDSKGKSPFVTGATAGWVNLLNAYAVSDTGQIVGQGTWRLANGAMQPRAFYLQVDASRIPPIPEPGIYLMLVSGLFAIGVVRLRRLSAR